ncbi:MAG: hypothetical protein ACFFCS_18525 [Candidatus Hodarchaeota archaeon]
MECKKELFLKSSLNKYGFKDSVSIEKLKEAVRTKQAGSKILPFSLIPRKIGDRYAGGIYLIVRDSTGPPRFVKDLSTVKFKKKEIERVLSNDKYLEEKWVDGTDVLYIGKADGTKKSSLYQRIKNYVRFGLGKGKNHAGGRNIWYLEDQENLLVTWKVLDDQIPEDAEKDLISCFKEIYKKFPFANRRN